MIAQNRDEAKTEKAESTIRILLIDDEPSILRFLLKVLFKQGYGVQAADRPEKAFELLSQNYYDIIITDLKMPELDGLALLKRVKESSPTTEVIMMTGFASVESATTALKLGAFDYLMKPFSVDEVLHVVKKAVRKHLASNDLNQFRDLDRLKEEFISNVNHELRTPLTSIKAAARILLDELQNKGPNLTVETIVKMLAMIDHNASKMTKLVDDLLDTFRFQTSKITLNNVPCSIEKIMAKCAEEFIGPCQQRELTLTSEIESPLPTLTADPIELRQAVLNLMGNAMKFTPPGGQIRIGARVIRSPVEVGGKIFFRPTEVEIFVKDTGIGIPPEEQAKIFDKFYQVDRSTTKNKEKAGLGLGLALTKSIVEAHCGTIHVESSLGNGSTFYLRFPVNPPEPKAGSFNAEPK